MQEVISQVVAKVILITNDNNNTISENIRFTLSRFQKLDNAFMLRFF